MARENGDAAMETARVPCNFCEFCRYQGTPLEQHAGAVSMESELKRLRLLTRRITGRDLDGLSFPELESLESRISHALEIVNNQKTQVEQEEGERMRSQKEQAANEVGTRRWPLAPCTRISSGERPQKQDDEAPKPVVNGLQREYERLLAEPMESEFERLWLLNERMNGRKLEGMSRLELLRLETQIIQSTSRILSHKFEPLDEERAKRYKEESRSILVEKDLLDEEKRCSLHNMKDISFRFRQRLPKRLPVSRKLRRFQKWKRGVVIISTSKVAGH